MRSADSILSPTLGNGRLVGSEVYERLRHMVVSLELPPGTVLSRSELMSLFGVSQTPIRDALAALAQEDLVEIYPQNATMVSRIDVDLALQAQFLRRALELEVAQRLSEAKDKIFLVKLRKAIDQQRYALNAGDLDDFDKADSRFHYEMYDAAGVPSLWFVVRRRSGHIDRLRRLNLPDEGKARSVLADHQEILTAIERGRPELAREAVRQHLSGTLSQLDDIRRRYPEFMLVPRPSITETAIGAPGAAKRAGRRTGA